MGLVCPSPPQLAGAPMGADAPLTAGGVLRLREGGGPCTDTSPHLASLCELLESILRKGLRREWPFVPGWGVAASQCPRRGASRSLSPTEPAWGFRRRDYWHWLEQLPTGTDGR